MSTKRNSPPRRKIPKNVMETAKNTLTIGNVKIVYVSAEVPHINATYVLAGLERDNNGKPVGLMLQFDYLISDEKISAAKRMISAKALTRAHLNLETARSLYRTLGKQLEEIDANKK